MERLETYTTKIESVEGDFSMEVGLIKVNKSVMSSVDNPIYKELINTYDYLNGTHFNGEDIKSQLPGHVVLGGAEYARIKMEMCLWLEMRENLLQS